MDWKVKVIFYGHRHNTKAYLRLMLKRFLTKDDYMNCLSNIDKFFGNNKCFLWMKYKYIYFLLEISLFQFSILYNLYTYLYKYIYIKLHCHMSSIMQIKIVSYCNWAFHHNPPLHS